MSNIKTGDILNFDYTGAVQSITLPKGIYKLECWGAQGGNGCTDNSYTGGKGGYSIGTISLNTKITLYIYVGGRGVSSEASGSGAIRAGGFNGGGSGRDWSSTNHGGSGGAGATDIRINQDSFYARVIVAGGGGGASDDGNGGSGGGVSGISTGASAGTATSGSGFGQAAASSYTSGECGGGGGGWYGGYGGGSENIPGGGGSGYVYISSTASNYPSGCLLNSSYYLSDAKTIAGNNSFVSPTGSSETGHSGNGYCRITVIECKNTALYTRINNSMKKATAFYFKLNNNKMYGIGSANSNGAVMNFDYTGSVQTATLTPGRYKLECWGAQGGNGSSNGNSNINAVGGLGGYSVGTITLSKTQKVYIYSGGKGQTKSNTGSYSTVNGGFNGGGSNYTCGSGGSGGGGSDIRIGTDSLYARVIVAGGGSGTGWTIKGAAGGGILGLSNYNSSYNSTQTAGGIAYTSAYNIMPTAGTFGIGGNGSGSSEGGSGGGGGWYGGGGAGYTGGSSGGSGYVYTSVTASNYPNGCLLNSSYYLSNAQTIAGDQSFPAPSGATETGHSDNGYCRITCYVKKKTLHCKMNNEIKKAAPVFMKMNNKIYDAGANAVMDFAYTGTAQAISLPRGKYIIECWGAQGGSYSSYYGGAGGYSVGTITLTKNSTDLYIYVGGQPEATTSTGETPGGFNGGGKGCSRTYNYSSYGQGGGGATDVRIGKNDLYARVIVAGGGGGSSSENSLTTKYGGGTTGGSSASGYGATQTAAGTNGSFGQGGSATTSGTNYNYGSGGGGGGWYGGGACSDYSDSTNYQGYNGGGSGYVYTSATAANYPSGNYVNSSYYLTNAQTIAGNQSFKSPDGTNETGHTGNGFCRITRKSGKIFVKQNGSWIKV